MPGEGIGGIVGKTIERVVIKEHRDNSDMPAMQVFLIFTDQTYYEVYCSRDMGFASCLDKGGREEVLRYLSDTMKVVYESFQGELGGPARGNSGK